MVSLLIILLIFLKTAKTISSTLEYRFYKNFGQRFIDYSGNSFHGINGGLLCKDSLDSIMTDRGVMMTKNVHRVTVPAINPFKKLLFASKEFSIAFWMKATKTSTNPTNVFGRYLGEKKYLRIVTSDSFQVEYYNQILLKIKHPTPCTQGNNHLDTWSFIGLSIERSVLNFYINSLVSTSSISQIWNENSRGACYLGSDTYSYNSFEGFIFSFSINLGPLIASEYFGGISAQCYRGICDPDSWTFSVIIEGTGYILPTSSSLNTDSSSNQCLSLCDNSCIGIYCLDCDCEALSCVIKVSNVNELDWQATYIKCYCKNRLNTDYDECYCNQGSLYGLMCQDSTISTSLCLSSYSTGECHLCNNPENVPNRQTCICSKRCTQTSSCTDCDQTCTRCSQSACLSCKDPNSSIDPFDDSRCVCNDGHYMQGTTCLPCDSSCQSCEDLTTCTECKEQTTSLLTGVCICGPGHYYEVSESTCKQCDENCSTCQTDSQCSECKTKYAVAKPDNNCDCEPDSILTLNECKCLPGTYRDQSGKCAQCPKLCEECSLDSEVVCSACINNFVLVDNSCLCETGYFVNQSNFCVETCADGYEVANGACVEICGSKCKMCSGSKCEVCIKNAESGDGVNCECARGFGGDLCEGLTFSAEVVGFDNKTVLIEFSELIDVGLDDSDFEVKYQNRNVNFNLSFVSGRVYGLGLGIDSTYTEEFLLRISEAESENGAKLYPQEYSFSITFKDAENRSDESSSQATQPQVQISQTASRVANITTTITKGAISASLTAAIVSNPSSFWTLFNTIEFISFLPLNAVNYPPKLKTFIQSFGTYSIIPIPIRGKNFVHSRPNPYKEADEYGLHTSLIIVNTFTYLAAFGLFIVILLILLLLKAIGGCGYIEFIGRKIDDYKYGFFIRFWIQGFLGLAIMAGVELKSWFDYKGLGISAFSGFSFCISIIVFALSSLTPAFVLIFGLVNKKSIKLEDFEFLKKYGSLYSELKNSKGFKASLYYFIFFLRRIIYIYSQIFLNDFIYLQTSLNIAGGCLVVLYIVVIFPFKERITFLAALVGEVITLEVTILTLFFIDSENDDETKLTIVSDVITFSILSMISVNFLISICQLFHSIKSSIQRVMKPNYAIDPQSTSSIHPNASCVTSQENRLNDKDFSVSELD